MGGSLAHQAVTSVVSITPADVNNDEEWFSANEGSGPQVTQVGPGAHPNHPKALISFIWTDQGKSSLHEGSWMIRKAIFFFFLSETPFFK